MIARKDPLRFSDVDGLAFAASNGRYAEIAPNIEFVPHQIGPLLELLQLVSSGRLPRPGKWLTSGASAPLVAALESTGATSWYSPDAQFTGFIRPSQNREKGGPGLTHFLMNAKRACQEISRIPSSVAGQLIAAIAELEDNIHQHSEALDTGIVAYRAEPGNFEFVVADRGIGILHSLHKCSVYSKLSDEGQALEAALTDGVSRHGPASNHGHGFRPIFVGLMNLQGELRFRSGDHAVIMDGTNPTLATAKVVQKARLDGFFASVKCHV